MLSVPELVELEILTNLYSLKEVLVLHSGLDLSLVSLGHRRLRLLSLVSSVDGFVAFAASSAHCRRLFLEGPETLWTSSRWFHKESFDGAIILHR